MAPVLSQEWLDTEQQYGGRSTLHGTAEEIWQQNAAIVAGLAPLLPPPSPNVESKDGKVDDVGYRIYTPKGHSGPPLPVFVYMHAGGFVIGDLDYEDLTCRFLCEHLPCAVVSVDYRLGPKYKAPTQLNDTMTVYNWALSNASSFGGDKNKFFSAGGSAGGGLALMVANQFAKKGDKTNNKGVLAVVPLTIHMNNCPAEYKSMYTSYQENDTNVPVIDADTMATFYASVNADPNDSDTFTGLSPHHKNFPPTYIVTCGADPLRDDGLVMEAMLKKAGVPTKSDHYEKLPHYFWLFPGFPPAEKFMGNLLGGAKWLLAQS